jgi:hypothetical protein
MKKRTGNITTSWARATDNNTILKSGGPKRTDQSKVLTINRPTKIYPTSIPISTF